MKTYMYRVVPAELDYLEQLNREGKSGWMYVCGNTAWLTFVQEEVELPHTFVQKEEVELPHTVSARNSRAFKELLNEFGICACCFSPGAARNDSYWCDSCLDCSDSCSTDINKAYKEMTARIEGLIDEYGENRSETFWDILLDRNDEAES